MSKRTPYKLSRPRGFFSLEREVYDSSAFRSLSMTERSVLFHLIYYFVPHNSEDIAMSGRRLGKELGINKDTAAKALRNLEASGLIRTTKESMWLNGFSRSYRLTFMAYQNRLATDEWKQFDFDGPNKWGGSTKKVGQGNEIHQSSVSNCPKKWDGS